MFKKGQHRTQEYRSIVNGGYINKKRSTEKK